MGFVVKCCSLLVLLAAVFLGFVFLYEGTMFRLLPQDDVPGLMNLLNSFKADNSAAKTVEDYDKKFNSVPDVSMVNDYYNMATDFYEYGWGQSFHFYTQRKGESHEEAIVRHEKNMVDTLGITAGMNVLDAGCGVGGPARTVARLSGAKVLGVTINDYQVMRARNHTERAGLSHLVEFKQGDYNKLDFIADASFDRAYASESTCHAVNLEGPYGQIFRVLKPGGLFFSYEWLATKHADRKNPEHARILRDIEYGDGLPPLRTLEEALAAAKNVGFELVKEEDLAEVVPKGGKPWYDRLDMGWLQHKLTHVMCWVMELLGLAPKGTVNTHGALLFAATGLVEGGKTKIFTPMHVLLFRKPVAAAPAAPAKAATSSPPPPAAAAAAKPAPAQGASSGAAKPATAPKK
eukprot:gnl/Spiro4/12684_TR6719_c0_g2_i1.p1 gnl/Spiro4/12684_TR6719_c0_g2~~gnl/Spiro4/12684_TR6719_c0_g2_i1.p1  ORF type:complete len:424 (-),score=173.22 gnl/Spiro4/12684_TR6719_c0_g2_i1:42-1256(-)